MDDVEQARAYAQADFAEPNARFLEQFAALFPDFGVGRVADLGCGPGDIALRFAQRWPGLQIDALDGSAPMLRLAREAAAALGATAARVRFVEGLLPGPALPSGAYDAVISNSLLHHLHDPGVLWQELRRLGRPGARVLVMDLFRPVDAAAAEAIVAAHAPGAPEVLRRDFLNSLHAAFEPDELRTQLQAAGLPTLFVRTVSDRHLIVGGRLPA
jgi:SAM-dependent methyltransferase